MATTEAVTVDSERLWRQAISLATVAKVSSRHVGIVNRFASHHLPYHNAIHGLETGMRAYQEALRLGLDPAQHLLAGWYHDLLHTGDPAADDRVNINLAVSIWAQFGTPEETRHSAWFGHGHDSVWMTEVTHLINATRWPHQPSRQIDVQVIRNADLAQTLDRPDWLERMTQETGKPASPHFAKLHMTAIA